jgi:hypothetical protein
MWATLTMTLNLMVGIKINGKKLISDAHYYITVRRKKIKLIKIRIKDLDVFDKCLLNWIDNPINDTLYLDKGVRQHEKILESLDRLRKKELIIYSSDLNEITKIYEITPRIAEPFSSIIIEQVINYSRDSIVCGDLIDVLTGN